MRQKLHSILPSASGTDYSSPSSTLLMLSTELLDATANSKNHRQRLCSTRHGSRRARRRSHMPVSVLAACASAYP